ncbi:hypothetical protein EJD97_020278 [Solanum chilense]|uniref:AAA+ ATPase domain-containing protein n=1 Tax=Solanum chilense TaxID=4083 RepID=A0A6N2CAT7_SOLCI|nr:hypothetical protein EJD97_020278 [Solanum chilense]
MAEILLTSVINKSVEIAGNLLIQEGKRLYWLKEDIDWLQREMRHIRSYVDNAKAKEAGGDSRVKNLLKDIQELAGDVEDILDDFLPKIQQSNKFNCCLKRSSFADEFAMEIEKIKIRVVDIDRIRKTYNIIDTDNNNDDCVLLDRRRLFLHADETEIIGLDDDFNMLQAKLLNQDLHYGVVSIVGMPGLGKTTLAKKLYRLIRDQFECSGLVYVSQQPRAGEILLDIAKQIGLTEQKMKENLEDNLRSLLKIKRYVILLDDIWDVEIWDDLKLVLPECDSKVGSRMIITTRNSNVGRYIGGESSLHALQPLESEKSFELFTKKIFNFDDNNSWANASPDLVNIGRNIVGRCGGIPLAIVVTAVMLRARERTEHARNRVLESMGHKVQDGCAKVLALSYNDLPIASRPCFLYFGLYPEDHEIRAFDLINMWIAEKFIVVNSGNRREAEDLAEDVLNDLVSRNLIQLAKRTYNGRISSCRIHDLLHSLCVDLAKEIMSQSFQAYVTIPSKFGNMTCLRYLRLEGNICGKLPNSIVKLTRLETIDIDRRSLIQLPYGVWESKHLRHLCYRDYGQACNSCFSISSFYPNIYSLHPNNLQTLMWIPDKFFEPRLLHRLINLRKLGILGVSNSTVKILSTCRPVPKAPEVLKLRFFSDPSEQINLSSYPKIVKLHLNVDRTIALNSEAFPPSIIKLTLVSFMVDSCLLAVLKTLPKLRKLKMVSCKYNEEKMALSGEANGYSFPQLEVLHIHSPNGLSEVTCTDDVSMPKLKKLLLTGFHCGISLSERLEKLSK